MRKVITIAHREFNAMVATKTFLLTLVMMPVLMLGGIVVLPAVKKLGGPKQRRIVVADGSGKLLESIQAAAGQRNQMLRAAARTPGEGEQPDARDSLLGVEFLHFEASEHPQLTDAQRLELSEQIRDGKLYAFVEIPSGFVDLESTETASFVSQDAVLSAARRWLSGHLRDQIRTQRLNQMGIDPQQVARAGENISLEPISPYTSGDQGKANRKQGADVLVSMFLPLGIMMLMFVVIFMAAQPMLESGMEEKQHRIAELLLGSVSAGQLMTGKLLGNVAGSLVIFSIYGVGGLLVAQHNDWQFNLARSELPWLLVFQVLGVLFFSSIFLAIGASVSELKEAQSLLLPVWLFLMLPMMTWFVVVRDPNGPVAIALSFFPPATPLMMSLRLASGQTIPGWQPPLAAILMLASTTVVIALASRIYRASLLKSDSAGSFRKLFQRLQAAE